MAVVRLIFRPCVGNHPMAPERMSFRFVARNHPMAPERMSFRFVARNHPTGVRFAARNHPSGRSASSSPQGAPISRVQNLKINRARPVNGPMASIGPYK